MPVIKDPSEMTVADQRVVKQVHLNTIIIVGTIIIIIIIILTIIIIIIIIIKKKENLLYVYQVVEGTKLQSGDLI